MLSTPWVLNFIPLLLVLEYKNNSVVSLVMEKAFLSTNQTKWISLFFSSLTSFLRETSPSLLPGRMISALPYSPLIVLFKCGASITWQKATCDTDPNPTLTARPRLLHEPDAPSHWRKALGFFPGTLQSLDGSYVLLFWVTGTWTPFCPFAMDTKEWVREPFLTLPQKKKRSN